MFFMKTSKKMTLFYENVVSITIERYKNSFSIIQESL